MGDARHRLYAWDSDAGDALRKARKAIAFVGYDEQLRLKALHRKSSVENFLIEHLDGADFLYREATAHEFAQVAHTLAVWQLTPIAKKKIATLSLGEMRLATIARAALSERKIYLLDEIFNSLSPAKAAFVTTWLNSLSQTAAVIITSHDAARMQDVSLNISWHLAGGKLQKSDLKPFYRQESFAEASREKTSIPVQSRQERLIHCAHADFFHDFVQIFHDLSFSVFAGERILVTGPNGSGKTTLLRIMHGDFYPVWESPDSGRGILHFENALEHTMKSDLWAKVQFIAATHFDYYPQSMTVHDVIASRYSGSIYDFADTLPPSAESCLRAFAIADFLAQPFKALSDGEKTRVLFARAFVLPAAAYLIDEGFLALSHRYFAVAAAYLNGVEPAATIVIAANERLEALRQALLFPLQEWTLAQGQIGFTKDSGMQMPIIG